MTVYDGSINLHTNYVTYLVLTSLEQHCGDQHEFFFLSKYPNSHFFLLNDLYQLCSSAVLEMSSGKL